MCDFDDDFDDMEDDIFFDEDMYDDEIESDPPGYDEIDEPEEIKTLGDDFTGKDAFFLGGAMGFAYGEGLQDAIWKLRKRI